jgi:copper(I)-binding protein
MFRVPHRPILALLACVASPVVGHAAPKPGPQITIDDAWFTTLPHDGPTYGYFQIANADGPARMMTGYASPACKSITLEEAHGGGINAKAAVQITVAPKSTMVFARDGYHLVCARPTGAIRVGGSVPVTISFLNGDTLKTAFQVRTYPFR